MPASIMNCAGPLARHFEAYISPIMPGEPASPPSLVLLKDLTREQQIERMRSDFVANASHELRTPLASLSGFIETLQGAARERRNGARKISRS